MPFFGWSSRDDATQTTSLRGLVSLLGLSHIWNSPSKKAVSGRSEAEGPPLAADSGIWKGYHGHRSAQSTYSCLIEVRGV